MDTKAAADAEPNWNNLVPAYIKSKPECPSDGEYKIDIMSIRPSCDKGNNGTEDTYDDHIIGDADSEDEEN